MIDFQINLVPSGVTKITTSETQVVFHVYFDPNNEAFHNHHTIILQNSNDITFCQVWFHENNNYQTPADLQLTGAIKNLNILSNSKKSIITIAIDKTFTGSQRFFAEVVSGDVDVSSFVTEAELITSLENLSDNLEITAEKIVKNSINPDYSNSSVQLTNGHSAFYVQTNSLDYDVNKVYTDWDLDAQPLTLIDKTTTNLSTAEANALMDDYPRPTYSLKPYTDFELKNLDFYVIRNQDLFFSNVAEFTLFPYLYRFGLIFDTSMLTNNFVKIKIQNLKAIAGSPQAIERVFPLFSGLSTTTGRTTYKEPTTAFRMWYNSTSFTTNSIIVLPTATSRVLATKTLSTIDEQSFWINKQGWYFGEKNEAPLLYRPITQTLSVSDTVTNIYDFTIVDGMDSTILPVAFGNINTKNGINDFSGFISAIRFTRSVTREITFTLRISVTGVLGSTNIRVQDGTLVKYTYVSNDSFSKVDVVDVRFKATTGSLSLIDTIDIKNQNYYDWAFTNDNLLLSVNSLMREPSRVLTTEQYNAFNPDQPITLNVTAQGTSPITLSNLSFFSLRNVFKVFTDSGSEIYVTNSYANRVQISVDVANLSTLSYALLTLDNISYRQGYPVANNQMFPASTSSTTNYYNLQLAEGVNGKINIGTNNVDFFTLPLVNYRPNFSGGADLFSTGNPIINAKFWIQRLTPTTAFLYQGFESEANDIITSVIDFPATSSGWVINLPLTTAYQNKIFYPKDTLGRHNWVIYNSTFNILAPYTPTPIINPQIYRFYIRLYCVYGSIVVGGTTKQSFGMEYNYSSQSFVGKPSKALVVNEPAQTLNNFKITLSIQLFNGSFAFVRHTVPYPTFPMNDLRVYDLIFEVNQLYFDSVNTEDAKQKLKYIGMRTIKL